MKFIVTFSGSLVLSMICRATLFLYNDLIPFLVNGESVSTLNDPQIMYLTATGEMKTTCKLNNS